MRTTRTTSPAATTPPGGGSPSASSRSTPATSRHEIVAAVDQGTNSTRLLVLGAGDPPVELARDLVITRLGQGVDASGRLDPDALARVEAVLTRYARRARALGATRIVVGATSAVRDAANRDDFVGDGRADDRRHPRDHRRGARGGALVRAARSPLSTPSSARSP